MDQITCPVCEKRIMGLRETESLLQKTTSKTLLSHCECGERLEIRSPTKRLFVVVSSSGKSQKITEGEELS